MTDTEAALQAELDKTPHNHFLRLLLSEHLQEIGDSRWRGYRCLALNERFPYLGSGFPSYSDFELGDVVDCSKLPVKWIDRFASAVHSLDVHHTSTGRWMGFSYRSDADDAAAEAFALLSHEYQSKLLICKMGGVQ